MLTPRITGLKPFHRIALCAFALIVLVPFLTLEIRPDFGEKILGKPYSSLLGKRPPSEQRPLEPKYFAWDTRSQFRPVRQDVENKTSDDLCQAFPKHLLLDIQPVLKTGHGVLENRVRPQLQSVSACLDDLIIVSDVDEGFEGREVIDVIADLPAGFKDNNTQLTVSGYYVQKALAENGTLATVTPKEAGIRGWELDKFKFLPQISRAWRMRPEKRWYVFYEADTYIAWDNMFRLLENFDPDVPLYFGSPSLGHDSWMANGGPGYVLSREAVRRLVKDDFGADGSFVESKLSERWEEEMMLDCCGDSVLGWALHEDAETTLSGLWLMFNPHPLHGVPFSDLYWCQPVISMHKTTTEDMVSLWRWEESRRDDRRPLLYADLVEYLNLTRMAVREDWHNGDWDGYPAPPDSTAHTSFEA